jgi:hypothetical protein
MFHSFPAMAIFAELTYLLFYGESMATRLYMVSAVCIGFFSHLILDEIYSVDWKGEPRLKSSFGTACKFIGPVPWANASCYSKLAALTLFVLKDPSVVQQIYAGNGGQVAQTLEQGIASTLGSAKNSKGGTSVVNQLEQAASQYFKGNRGGQPANMNGNNGQPYNPSQMNPSQNNWAGGQQSQYSNRQMPFNGQQPNYAQAPSYQQPRPVPNNYYGNTNNAPPAYAPPSNFVPQGQYPTPPMSAPNNYGGQPNYATPANVNPAYGGQGGFAPTANQPQGYPAGYQQPPPAFPTQSNASAPASYGQPSYGQPTGGVAPSDASLTPANGATPRAANNSWQASPMQ